MVQVDFPGAVYQMMDQGNESIQWTPPEIGYTGVEIAFF